ncbi:hypothetical protein [Nonomuraea cavernae]|uniref:hypothetical protein n=1 Tax=Nonomuraea cavernae TaxID=2045107 RepID=UPI0033FD5C43
MGESAPAWTAERSRPGGFGGNRPASIHVLERTTANALALRELLDLGTDFAPCDRRPNALVATSLDVPRFWDLVLGAYTRLGERLG